MRFRSPSRLTTCSSWCACARRISRGCGGSESCWRGTTSGPSASWSWARPEQRPAPATRIRRRRTSPRTWSGSLSTADRWTPRRARDRGPRVDRAVENAPRALVIALGGLGAAVGLLAGVQARYALAVAIAVLFVAVVLADITL